MTTKSSGAIIYYDQDGGPIRRTVTAEDVEAMEAALNELIRLHEFYKTNTFGCDMPGNEKYSTWLMDIVLMAQKAVER